MKKKLSALALAFCALISVAQARFYIGIDAGYSAQSYYQSNLKAKSLQTAVFGLDSISDAINKGVSGYSVAGVIGTENFYWDYLGTRFGISGGYTSVYSKSHKHTAEYIDAGSSSDLMINFVSNKTFALGIFGGTSVDYHYILSNLKNLPGGIIKSDMNAKHLLDFSWRVGMSMRFANHHRFEFLAKLPFASLNVATDKVVLGGVVTAARTSFLASYKFVF